MPRRPFVSGMLIVAAMVPSVATAGPRDRLSWGRAGVSLEEYREQAAACNKSGGLMDIRSADATKRFLQGFEQNERSLNMASTEGLSLDRHRLTRETLNPQRQIDRVEKLQYSQVERCLIDSGYRRFELTKSQQKQLDRLAKGSAERRAYLHSLASDERVLTSQGVD